MNFNFLYSSKIVSISYIDINGDYILTVLGNLSTNGIEKKFYVSKIITPLNPADFYSGDVLSEILYKFMDLMKSRLKQNNINFIFSEGTPIFHSNPAKRLNLNDENSNTYEFKFNYCRDDLQKFRTVNQLTELIKEEWRKDNEF